MSKIKRNPDGSWDFIKLKRRPLTARERIYKSYERLFTKRDRGCY